MSRRAVAAAALVTVLLAGACTDAGRASTGPSASSSTAAGPVAAAPEVTKTSPPSPPPPVAAVTRTPVAAANVLRADRPVPAALAASRTVFVSAPVVVLAPAADPAATLTAASAAVGLGVPALQTGTPAEAPGVRRELERLEAQAVLLVGDADASVLPDDVVVVRVAAGARRADLSRVTRVTFGKAQAVAAVERVSAVRGLSQEATPVLVDETAPPPAAATAPTASATPRPSATETTPASSSAASPSGASSSAEPTSAPTPASNPAPASSSGPLESSVLPRTRPAEPAPGVVALTGVGTDPLAAVATLRAAGLPFVDVPGGDPRAATTVVEALTEAAPQHVVALGKAFGEPERLAARVATASTGVVIPGGGQLVFPAAPGTPHKKYVALYGTPGSKALGVLGEQDVPATVARAQKFGRQFRPLTEDTVVPMVEIIATIASAGAGDDGDYSRERPVSELRPLVDAAGEAGVAVVLDLQPGRADFLTQAKRYQELLELPHVGLALDPEWRLEPDEVHLEQIGSVGIDEVNAVGDWLAELVAREHLPQKAFVLHQFSLRMIDGRERLDTSHDELATLIHVDGQGSQPAKQGTWRALRAGAPAVHWGWKNFFDEDSPMLTPAQTYQVDPVPDLVTYQ